MSDDTYIVQLIKEVESNLSNQMNALGNRLSERISTLENSTKRKKKFLSSITMYIITAVIGASVVYAQNHIKVSYTQHAEISK